ncbi:unnamed protein product (macronuclear) [Paramecium tetraurelia]|uniref:Uncharacterized protein n=1 Tax=Paramecium tetraurelia TaxID=5888 RepID=A0DXI0_PARTE|nr:uncharacterized protein GSPATT00039821001 [Paramecium tetraurelia]CAK87747.1 unnamed protein product [Paramecium tetraurelia]|eukprot:XP_001455144.1 hypothetical protein (macronuclear) [Paramecium tetraurelia strain d4-2]
MFKPEMIENEKDFSCSQGHNLPVVTIALDPNISMNQRLLCTECLENTDLGAKVVGLKKIISLIEEGQIKKMEKVQYLVTSQIQLIEQLHCLVDQMKSLAIQQFDQSISILKEWIQSLQQKGQQYRYSFQEELQIMLQKQNKADDQLQFLTYEIQQINHCLTSKLHPKLEQFNTFKGYTKCKELLSNLELSSQKFNKSQLQEQGFQQQPNDEKQVIIKKHEIRLKLIDQSVKQLELCKVIVFDSSGSIMISTQMYDIKVWSFLNGTIKLVKTLQGHTSWIQCLVYSKKQNSFISCSSDETIRCWQQMNQTEWISSQPYQEHTNFVRCIILNQNEDLLFSGSGDKSIKVWRVDFNQNQLTFLYSLDKHNDFVTSLSLNQSENQLVSCACGQNEIIIWERTENDQFKFKYFVKQSIQEYGLKVKFIKDNQFIWITGGKQIDKIYVFELEQGVFQENQDKTIQLTKNEQIFDEYCFPIIYNKERNLIIVRHKTYIYIIREINDGNYKIQDQLNCNTYDIYGAITNNGQYLVYWDDKEQGYSIYELLNQ